MFVLGELYRKDKSHSHDKEVVQMKYREQKSYTLCTCTSIA
jgi:hypothetical protein